MADKIEELTNRAAKEVNKVAHKVSEGVDRALSKNVFKSFEDFYPYYLKEHSNRTCRRLHVIGTILGLTLFLYFVLTGSFGKLWIPFVVAYGCAWV
jgi:hypothetical protein